MRSRIQNLFATIVTIIVVSGCAVGSAPSEIPSNLLDGVHTHKFIQNAPTICRYNCIDRVSTYTGQWVNNRPKGQGAVIGNDGLTCRGEFGIQRPNTSLPDPTQSDTVLLLQEGGEEKAAKDNYIWAKGEVFNNGKPWFTGTFRNNFYFGEGCMPFGEDTWTSDISGALMSGTVKVDFDRRSGKYSSTMAVGSCKIIRKDGAVFEGSCDAPPEYQIAKGEIGLLSMKDLLSRDAFFLAAAGTFTEPSGKRLSGPESEQKIAQYKQYILAKQRADAALAAEAARENQRQRIAKAQEDAHQSAANWQAVLAIAGATASNYGAQSNQRTSQAAGAALPLAQLQPIPSSTKVTTVASSAAGLPSPTTSIQQPAQTSGGLDSQKLYTYKVDSKFRGIGETEEAGCKAAEKDAADWSPTLADDNRKLLSRGSCSCTNGYSNFFGKALECTIPYKMEITSPNSPNTRSGPSAGVSK